MERLFLLRVSFSLFFSPCSPKTNKMHRYVKIEVMDYFPESRYSAEVWWPDIGDALKTAVFEF